MSPEYPPGIPEQLSSGSGKAPTEDAALALCYSFDKGGASDGSGNKNDGKIENATAVKGKFGKAMKFVAKRGRKMPFKIKYHWTQDIPLHVRAMVVADKTLFIAGPPVFVDEEKSFETFAEADTQAKLAEERASFDGKEGGMLWAVSIADGEKLAEYKLDTPPAWDSMVGAKGASSSRRLTAKSVASRGRSRATARVKDVGP